MLRRSALSSQQRLRCSQYAVWASVQQLLHGTDESCSNGVAQLCLSIPASPACWCACSRPAVRPWPQASSSSPAPGTYSKACCRLPCPGHSVRQEAAGDCVQPGQAGPVPSRRCVRAAVGSDAETRMMGVKGRSSGMATWFSQILDCCDTHRQRSGLRSLPASCDRSGCTCTHASQLWAPPAAFAAAAARLLQLSEPTSHACPNLLLLAAWHPRRQVHVCVPRLLDVVRGERCVDNSCPNRNCLGQGILRCAIFRNIAQPAQARLSTRPDALGRSCRAE